MSTLLRRALHKALICGLILSLLPFDVLAQEGGSIFLPLVTSGRRAIEQGVLFRTRVTVTTADQWHTLDRLGAPLLDRGDDWAVVMVDDLQLEELARLRYNPDSTSNLQELAAANRSFATSPILKDLLTAEADMASQRSAVVDINNAARANLRAEVGRLSNAALAMVATANSLDGDSDGLTDTQETFWCTNLAVADSDFDGISDGVEVQKLKDWMSNKSYAYPSTGKPFQGWPPQKSGCYDDDSDSVPDAAEMLELGLSASRESTDRDKFDDGQELFGITFCTGQGGFCSYGLLPRNQDWGAIFSEMPSWVKAPGNHPLVGAFPVPEVDIVESSLVVQLATIVTTDHTMLTGTTATYGTERTEGESTSVADTQTWNDWQEVFSSKEELAPALARASTPNEFDLRSSTTLPPALQRYFGLDFSQLTLDYNTMRSGCQNLAPYVGNTTSVNLGFDYKLAVGGGYDWQYGTTSSMDATFTAPMCQAYIAQYCEKYAGDLDGVLKRFCENANTLSGTRQYQEMGPNQSNSRTLANNALDTNSLIGGLGGIQLSQLNSGEIIAKRLQELTFTLSRPKIITGERRGHSTGGAQTTTHEKYEEHTVSTSDALSSEESWSTATAVNSDHAADLWFSYKVRNSGTEFAHEICNLTFNVYVGDDPNPVYSYYVPADRSGTCFESFDPGEEHVFSARTNTHAIPLTLEQLKTVDLGGSIRIVVEDFNYGIDEPFYRDAVGAGLIVALEDGSSDGDELVDTYLIPSWRTETVLQVLARYFPYETDADGMIIAIWTPEHRSDTPGWCLSPRRPTDQPGKVLWCKHALSTADWWDVYTDGLGDSSEGFQDRLAMPSATVFFRFNQDSDLDGYSDRSEVRLGTDSNDASSLPKSELLAGVHNLRSGNRVTSTISLLNTGFYDVYGVDAVMIAPDDSVTVDNNTVGGSGRVKALKQVIVGSSILLQSPLPMQWLQAGHASPTAGGYYTGNIDRSFTFTVNCPFAGGCKVGEGTWTLGWNDGAGSSGTLSVGMGYTSPTFLTVGAHGLTMALKSGNVQNGESLTVAAKAPRDTFQYTINREPFTEPIVVVSYNDPQGNHRFVVPSQAMSLTAPTDNLQQFAGQMLQDVGLEIVTHQPSAMGSNTIQLLVNNPTDRTLQNAHLLLEFINISGTVVSEVNNQVVLPSGPTYTPIAFSTGDFFPSFDSQQDYIVMAFLTDYEGNILDSTGRPLSSFQADPMPKVSVDANTLTWDFGTVAQGALLKHALGMANTGYGRLFTYLTPVTGLGLTTLIDSVGAADLADYELILRTADLPTGEYDQTTTLKTSDPTQPTLTLHVRGTVTATTGDVSGGLQRPMDWTVTVQGPRNRGESVENIHALGPDPQGLHPVMVYSQNYATHFGVGKYATEFGQGTPSSTMFGNGLDGDLSVSPGQTVTIDQTRTAIGASGTAASPASSTGFAVGDLVFFHQTQGTANAGRWELNTILAINSSTSWTLSKPLVYAYSNTSGRAQALKVPQYRSVVVAGSGTLTAPAWDGQTGGILFFLANDTVTIHSGAVLEMSGRGFRAGAGAVATNAQQGESYTGVGTSDWHANGGAGGGASYSGDGARPGAGAGYGSTGASPALNGSGSPIAQGGAAYGVADLTYLHLGSGGGGANDGRASGCTTGDGRGGTGGGVVGIVAKALTVNGAVRTNGTNGTSRYDTCDYHRTFGAGGGSGGSVLIQTRNANVGSSITAVGGLGGADWSKSEVYPGGNGAAGRIRLEYCESLAGSGNPAPSTQILSCHLVEQIETAPFTTARLNLPETISTATTYIIQYARRLAFGAGGSQVSTLRVPAGMFVDVRLDALVSQLPANATLSLDLGNDGTTEWTGTVANNSTSPLSGLAPAFNAYWVANGAPATGILDVPVKSTISQAGQVLLTNLQVTTAGSKLRVLRLPPRVLTQATLDLALGGSGAHAVTIAVDVGDNGSLDWTSSVSTTLPVRLTTGNLAAAINAFLAGKSGLIDVPLRIHVAPDLPVALYDAQLSTLSTTDLAVAGLNAGSQGRTSDATLYTVGDVVPLQATLTNPSGADSGPVTAAFFAYAEGWGDWLVGSAFVANIPAGGSVPIRTMWDTTGFTGTVPIKTVVNPYGRLAEMNTSNNTAQATVSLTPPELPPAADFVAAPTTGSAALTVHFTETSSAASPISAWAWEFGDGGTSTQQNPIHIYNQAGVYTVVLTVTNTAGSDTHVRSAYIQVDAPVQPPQAAFGANPVAGNAPLAVQFSDLATGSITSWQWDFGDGAFSSERQPNHVYSSPGAYTVTLTVTGPGGSNIAVVPAFINVGPGQVTVNLPAATGWNLLSLPVQPANHSPSAVLAPIAGRYDLVYAYQGCDTADPWKKYDPAAPPFANDLAELSGGRGFWVRLTAAATLTVTGLPYTSTAVDLCPGWNLAGYPSQYATATASAIQGVAACLSIVYSYRAADGNDPWKKYDPIAPPFANDLATMAPGYGYWMNAASRCTWQVNNQP